MLTTELNQKDLELLLPMFNHDLEDLEGWLNDSDMSKDVLKNTLEFFYNNSHLNCIGTNLINHYNYGEILVDENEFYITNDNIYFHQDDDDHPFIYLEYKFDGSWVEGYYDENDITECEDGGYYLSTDVVETYDSYYYLNDDDIYSFARDSRYSGEYFRKYDLNNGDVVYSEYEDGYYHVDEMVYSDRENDWVLECNYKEGNIASYHQLERLDFSNENHFSDFLIGFEIEKNSVPIDIADCDYNEIHENTGFCLEEDCSVNGYELISPKLDMFDNIESYFKGVSDLVNHHDSNSQANCGGHISISHRENTTIDLYSMIEYYIPLLYIMFPDRCNNRYSLSTNKDAIKSGSARRAISIENKRIEFRIFPYVKNMDDIMNRTKLIRYFVTNPVNNCKDVINQLQSNELHKIIKSVAVDIDLINIISNYQKTATKYFF